MTALNFSIPQQTQQLWQDISSRWSHCDRPKGQRFLGSVRIGQKSTDRVLDIVGYNLKNLDKVTCTKLYERFYEPQQNWLKILTFALSEYAYYYSNAEEKFWHGFCERLKLPYTQTKANAFRQIVGEGFNLLGLVQAKGGYRYVSTLWLQSGIPKENINHFSQLVQDFSNEYGWWEVAHTSCEDISEELLAFCREKHSQWATLINFLKASCSQEEENAAEPISGQILKGIAVIAVELERQGRLPEELKNDNEREKFLGNYYLPNNFFLRNWDSLIKVLTPQQHRQGNRRTIISRRQKPLSLVLDVADSLNMQLLLPEQNLWKKGWEYLAGTFCQIPEVSWEGTIPKSPGLIIPEQVIDIKSTSELWKWQLLDKRSHCLSEWKLEGVASDFPCLIFDAWTGERLNLDSAHPAILGTKEIICFTPKESRLTFSDGIELVTSQVPSSIKGWQGQHLTLTAQASTIVLTVFGDGEIVTFRSIAWELSSDQQPSLRGLQLKGKKFVYLEIPTFWYPPVVGAISLNISLENVTQKQTVIGTAVKLAPSLDWQAIPLNQWIAKPGKYEARFWNSSYHLSYKFEIQSNYQITKQPDRENLQIRSGLQGQIESFPIFYDSHDKFWSEEIHLEGLFPLESINLSLSDRQETTFYQERADSSGRLSINLASLYGLLSYNSDWYALDYQRQGCELQRLIEKKIAPLSIGSSWSDRAINLSGLSPDELYFLSCWNLLLPESPPIKVNCPLIAPDGDTATVPLELPIGIYHLQLMSSRGLRHSLGCWCSRSQIELTQEASGNEKLENYCYTILGDESIEDFINAAQNFDWDCQFLERVIHSLQTLPCHFPQWLNHNSLVQKLQALLKILKIDLKSPTSLEKNPVKLETANNASAATPQKNWLLIKLSNSQKRNLVRKFIDIAIKQHNLQNDILSIQIPNQWIYKDSILLECQDPKLVSSYIQAIDYVQIIQALTYQDAQKIC